MTLLSLNCALNDCSTIRDSFVSILVAAACIWWKKISSVTKMTHNLWFIFWKSHAITHSLWITDFLFWKLERIFDLWILTGKVCRGEFNHKNMFRWLIEFPFSSRVLNWKFLLIYSRESILEYQGIHVPKPVGPGPGQDQ